MISKLESSSTQNSNETFTDIHVIPDLDDVFENAVDFTSYTIENDDAPLVQIHDLVFCEDDFTGENFEAVYLGWYLDYNNYEETSPYWNECSKGVHRLVVRRLRDNGLDYVLPENCFSEAQISKYWKVTVKAGV